MYDTVFTAVDTVLVKEFEVISHAIIACRRHGFPCCQHQFPESTTSRVKWLLDKKKT